jgi:hypothetical protein
VDVYDSFAFFRFAFFSPVAGSFRIFFQSIRLNVLMLSTSTIEFRSTSSFDFSSLSCYRRAAVFDTWKHSGSISWRIFLFALHALYTMPFPKRWVGIFRDGSLTEQNWILF